MVHLPQPVDLRVGHEGAEGLVVEPGVARVDRSADVERNAGADRHAAGAVGALFGNE